MLNGSRLRKVLNLEIPLRTLLESPTIEQMAAVIKEHRGKQLGEEYMDRMLGELESLFDGEAQRLVVEETTSTTEDERHE